MIVRQKEGGNMISVVDNYMKNKGITITDIAKASGISISTLSNAFKKPVANWSIRILNGLAATTFDDPAQVLTELQPRPFKYVVDDDKQTIQGFHIEDPHLFWVVEAAVHNSVMEGWQPTKADIMDTYRVITEPQPELERDFKQIFGDDHGDK